MAAVEPNVAAAEEQKRKKQRPMCSEEEAIAFAARIFGLRDVSDVKELESYDDRNFYLKALSPGQADGQPDKEEFVLKIHNGVESRTDTCKLLEAQNAVLLHLNEHGVLCPAPLLAQTTGSHLDFVVLDSKDGLKTRHGIRLLRFLPGKLMSDVEHTDVLLTDLGRFVGRMANELQSFDHKGAHRHHLWDLFNLTELEPFTKFVTDPERLEIIKEIMARFKRDYLSKADSFPRCVLQNDANDHNIVVTDDHQHVSGIIDFGDMVYTTTVNELAITVAYALLDKEDLMKTAKLVIQGFTEIRPLSKDEASVLHTLTTSRLCQSAVMSAFSYSQDPSNQYLLVTQKPGWAALRKLMAMDEATIQRFNAFAHTQ